MAAPVMYEGWLEKKATKWKKYYAAVKGSRIFFYKNEKMEIESNLVGHLEINASEGVTIGESKKKAYTWWVTSQTGRYNLKVSTEDARHAWMDAIQKGCLNHGGSMRLDGLGTSSGFERGESVADRMGDRALPAPPPGDAPQLPSRTASSTSARPLPAPPPGGSGPAVPPSRSGDCFVAPPPTADDPFSGESWHFGKTSRSVSEKLLDRHGSDGNFLLRASESTPGDFTMSVKDQGETRHYKISKTPQGVLKLTGCAEEDFITLGALVEYYIKSSKGRSQPLDKVAVEKMERAFAAPATITEGAMLPGMRFAMEEANRR